MDFKSIAEYNSAVHKICSKLRFCDQPIDDAEKIEKTLSTFLLANRILQQQYRRHKYTKYSDLIYDLLQAEKHDELLTKNHQLVDHKTEAWNKSCGRQSYILQQI